MFLLGEIWYKSILQAKGEGGKMITHLLTSKCSWYYAGNPN